MSNENQKKAKARWRPGGERYSSRDSAALRKAREASGWRNGARVIRR